MSLASDIRSRLHRVPHWLVVLLVILLSLLALGTLWASQGDAPSPVEVVRYE